MTYIYYMDRDDMCTHIQDLKPINTSDDKKPNLENVSYNELLNNIQVPKQQVPLQQVPVQYKPEQHYQAAIHNRRVEHIPPVQTQLQQQVQNNMHQRPQQYQQPYQTHQPHIQQIHPSHSPQFHQPQSILKISSNKHAKWKKYLILFFIILLYNCPPLQNALCRAFPNIFQHYPSFSGAFIGSISVVGIYALVIHLLES